MHVTTGFLTYKNCFPLDLPYQRAEKQKNDPFMRDALLLLIVVVLASCGKTNLDELPRKTYYLEELPDTLKNIYRDAALTDNREVTYTIVSTDRRFKLIHEWEGVTGGLSWFYASHLHHFYINGQHFSMGANQGDPFILHDKKLYYTTELNLADYNYKNARYIVIDLKGHLDE